MLVTGHIYSFHVLNYMAQILMTLILVFVNYLTWPLVFRIHVIAGGDFSCVLDQFLDAQLPSAASKVLRNLAVSMNLLDIWRLQHPTTRDYSFFSQRHTSSSRIDFFLLDSNLISNVISTKYHNILTFTHSLETQKFPDSLYELYLTDIKRE